MVVFVCIVLQIEKFNCEFLFPLQIECCFQSINTNYDNFRGERVSLYNVIIFNWMVSNKNIILIEYFGIYVTGITHFLFT